MEANISQNNLQPAIEVQNAQTSPVLDQVIARAIGDAAFREILFRDPGAIAAEYKLNAADLDALDLLTPDILDRTGDIALLVGSNC